MSNWEDRSVDLSNIQYVWIVDIPGDGIITDSFGNPVYDPYPGIGNTGVDLEAIGVINESN